MKNLQSKDIKQLNSFLLLCIKMEKIDKDINKAIYWYEKCAKQDNQSAQFNLANIYENGDEISKDIDKAIYWYENLQSKDIKQLNLFLLLYILKLRWN